MTSQVAGWYWAEGDPEGTKRYWNGESWNPGIVGLEPWRRVGARLIDGAIMLIFYLLFVWIFGADFRFNYLTALLFTIIAVFYEVGFVTTRGGTPGKLILGFQIVEVETGQIPPRGSIASVRWSPALVQVIPYLGAFVSLAVYGICLYWIFSDPCCRTVYDRVAKTYVVRMPDRGLVL